MKTWKLVSGILSIALSLFVVFQSCAAGIGNALEANGEVSGTSGLIVAILPAVSSPSPRETAEKAAASR